MDWSIVLVIIGAVAFGYMLGYLHAASSLFRGWK